MRGALRILVGGVALFNITLGIGFLLAPARLGAALFVGPLSSQGLATMRADFPGFFIGGGLFALAGAWTGSRTHLRVPMLLLGIALGGRCVSLVADGAGPDAATPMLVEAAMLLVLGAATRAFGRPVRR